MAKMDDRTRYDRWWHSAPGLPCETCKRGESDHARVIREQGPSFFPMRNFGPDRRALPVRYLLIGWEPSEHGFDRRIREGMRPEDARNFGGSSIGSLDSVLQFAAREWLCDATETFLLTDVAKCAVRNARDEPPARRDYRWANCAPFLEQEAAMFDLRAVIAVGKPVRDELRRRASMAERIVFRVIHFASRTANQQRLLASDAERHVDDATSNRLVDFLSERRLALGKTVQRNRVNSAAGTLLAVYRKQFTCIRRALADRSYDCGQRASGSCCKSVSTTQSFPA